MSSPHTGQRDPPPAPRPLPGGGLILLGGGRGRARALAGAGGTGRDVGLLVSRKGVMAEEKAEQALETQAGTVSSSLLPRGALGCCGHSLALEGGRETPTGLSSPSTGKARLPGKRPSLHTACPRHAGLDSPR